MRIFRRVALLACLVVAMPALAQAPPPVPPLPDTARTTTYTVTASIGPLDVGFAIYGDGTDYGNWLEVWNDGAKLTPGTDWFLTLASGTLGSAARPLTNARVNFTARRSGQIVIVGARRPRRTSQLAENQGITARAFNQLNTDLVAMARERWDALARTLMVPAGEVLRLLPPAAQRANAVLGFDGAGALTLLPPGTSQTVFQQDAPGALTTTMMENGRATVNLVPQFVSGPSSDATCATVDQSAQIQKALDFVGSADAYSVLRLNKKGIYCGCNLVISGNSGLDFSFGSRLKKTPSCETSLIQTKHAWRNIMRRTQVDATADQTYIIVSEVEGVAAGHTIMIQDEGGVFHFATVTGTAGIASTPPSYRINFSGAIGDTNAVPTNSKWINASEDQQAAIQINNGSFDGSKYLQYSGYKNVAQPQAVAAPGDLVLDGDMTIGGVAYMTPMHGWPLSICDSNASDIGKKITVTGKLYRNDWRLGPEVIEDYFLNGGCGWTQHQFSKITSINSDEALVGQIYAGWPDGPTGGDVVTFNAPGWKFWNFEAFLGRGCGFRSDWTSGGGGATATPSPWFDIQAEAYGLKTYWNDGCGHFIDGPNDNRFINVVSNFNSGWATWYWGRWSAGTIVKSGHSSGGNIGGGVYASTMYSSVVDADQLSLDDTNHEEAFRANVLLRANNFRGSGVYFNPQVFYLGVQPSCVIVGDPDYMSTSYKVWIYKFDVQLNYCGQNNFYFYSGLEQGGGIITARGIGYQTTLAATVNDGDSTIKFDCDGDSAVVGRPACYNKLGPGFTLNVHRDDGSVVLVQLGAYNSGPKTFDLTAPFSGTATSGALVQRETAIGGAPMSDPTWRSDITSYFTQGVYPLTYVQHPWGGISGTKTRRNSAGTGTCTDTYTYGLLTGSDC